MITANDILSNDFAFADTSEPLSRLIGRMKTPEACIFEGKNLAGMLSYRKILKSKMDVSQIQLSNLTDRVPVLDPEKNLMNISRLMFESGKQMLPVTEQQFAGVVHASDVLKKLDQIEGLSKIKVKDIRQQKDKISETEKVNKSIELMYDKNISALPVIAGGRHAGVLTSHNLLTKFYIRMAGGNERSLPHKAHSPTFQAESVLHLPVSDFMDQTPAVVIPESMSVVEAASTLVNQKVPCLIVSGNYISWMELLEAASRQETVENVELVGLSELPVIDELKETIKEAAIRHHEKFLKLVSSELKTVLHVKSYSETGDRHKYSIHARAEYPGGPEVSSSAHDWDALRAVQESLNDLEKQLKKKFNKRLTMRKVR